MAKKPKKAEVVEDQAEMSDYDKLIAEREAYTAKLREKKGKV